MDFYGCTFASFDLLQLALALSWLVPKANQNCHWM